MRKSSKWFLSHSKVNSSNEAVNRSHVRYVMPCSHQQNMLSQSRFPWTKFNNRKKGFKFSLTFIFIVPNLESKNGVQVYEGSTTAVCKRLRLGQYNTCFESWRTLLQATAFNKTQLPLKWANLVWRLAWIWFYKPTSNCHRAKAEPSVSYLWFDLIQK